MRRTWAVLVSLPLVYSELRGRIRRGGGFGAARNVAGSSGRGLSAWSGCPASMVSPGAMLTLTFLSYPYVLLTVRAALQRIDPALEESARGLGLGPAATFFRVVAPAAAACHRGRSIVGRPVHAQRFRGGLAAALRNFHLGHIFAVRVLPRPHTGRRAFAGARGACPGLVALEFISRGRSRYYSTSSGTTRPAQTVRLDKWRWPSVALCASVTGLGLGLPVGILVYWVCPWRGSRRITGPTVGCGPQFPVHIRPGSLGGHPCRSAGGIAFSKSIRGC